MLVLAGASGEPASCPLGSPLQVRFRQGGERIRPAGDAHTRELRDLLQRAGIPPWQRAGIPLIFSGDELMAVADLWSSDAGRRLFEGMGVHLRWQRPD
jgi:tRNA(Ile)-lysidine synthase